MTKIPLSGLKRGGLIRFLEGDSIFEVSAKNTFSDLFGQNAEVQKMTFFAQNWDFPERHGKAPMDSHIMDFSFLCHSA